MRVANPRTRNVALEVLDSRFRCLWIRGLFPEAESSNHVNAKACAQPRSNLIPSTVVEVHLPSQQILDHSVFSMKSLSRLLAKRGPSRRTCTGMLEV